MARIPHPAATNPRRWGVVRQFVLKRDNYRCRACGKAGLLGSGPTLYPSRMAAIGGPRRPEVRRVSTGKDRMSSAANHITRGVFGTAGIASSSGSAAPLTIPGCSRAGVRALHVTDLQHPWRRIRSRAGLDDIRIHDLRHHPHPRFASPLRQRRSPGRRRPAHDRQTARAHPGADHRPLRPSRQRSRQVGRKPDRQQDR